MRENIEEAASRKQKENVDTNAIFDKVAAFTFLLAFFLGHLAAMDPARLGVVIRSWCSHIPRERAEDGLNAKRVIIAYPFFFLQIAFFSH